MTWVKELRAKREWGLEVLARVYYRSLTDGSEPSEAEVLDLLQNKTALETVTDEQIIDAYSCGQEASVHATPFLCYYADSRDSGSMSTL